jgi:hypothetical protein
MDCLSSETLTCNPMWLPPTECDAEHTHGIELGWSSIINNHAASDHMLEPTSAMARMTMLCSILYMLHSSRFDFHTLCHPTLRLGILSCCTETAPAQSTQRSQAGLDLMLTKSIAFQCHSSPEAAAYHTGAALSKIFLDEKYNLASLMLKYDGVDWRDSRHWNCNSRSDLASCTLTAAHSSIPQAEM